MNPPSQPALNLNTVLLTLILGLSGWTLNRVASLGEQMSAVNERDTSRVREILEIRTRLTTVEAQLQANSLAIARMGVGTR